MDTKNDRKIKDLTEEEDNKERWQKYTELFKKVFSQFSSVTQLYLTLHDPMDCSTPGLPVHHQPPELAQTHVHWVGDSIQPSHPLSSPSPPTFKYDENTQSWHTPFPIWNKSIAPCPVLTVASWPPYRFLRRQVRWSGIPISFRIFHSLWWSTQSKALA